MPDFIEPVLSFVQELGRFIKSAWESVYAYGRFLRARFAPKPYGFKAALDRVRSNDPSMTSLDLSYMDLSDWNIIELGYALAGNMTISSLYLIRCRLSIASIQALNQIITLTSLIIRNSNIGDAGTSPGISYSNISDAGAQALAANTTVTSLDISYSNIGDAGVQALAANTTITSLDISYCNIGDAGAQALAANTTITSLNLSHNQIGNAGALAILNNRTLRSLWINNNSFLNSLDAAHWNMFDHHFSGASSMLTFLDVREDNQLSDRFFDDPDFHPKPGFNWLVILYRAFLSSKEKKREIYRAVNGISSAINNTPNTRRLPSDIVVKISSYLTSRSVHSIIARAEQRGLRVSNHLQLETANTDVLTSEHAIGSTLHL